MSQIEQRYGEMTAEEFAAAMGYAPQHTASLGELAIDVQLDRWGGIGGDHARACFLAERERQVAAGSMPHDPEQPQGYEFRGRTYQV